MNEFCDLSCRCVECHRKKIFLKVFGTTSLGNYVTLEVECQVEVLANVILKMESDAKQMLLDTWSDTNLTQGQKEAKEREIYQIYQRIAEIKDEIKSVLEVE